jgi:hypothetical protein
MQATAKVTLTLSKADLDSTVRALKDTLAKLHYERQMYVPGGQKHTTVSQRIDRLEYVHGQLKDSLHALNGCCKHGVDVMIFCESCGE